MGLSKDLGGKDGSTLVSFRLTQELKKTFDAVCTERGEKGSEVFRRVVQEWVRDQLGKGYGLILGEPIESGE